MNIKYFLASIVIGTSVLVHLGAMHDAHDAPTPPVRDEGTFGIAAGTMDPAVFNDVTKTFEQIVNLFIPVEPYDAVKQREKEELAPFMQECQAIIEEIESDPKIKRLFPSDSPRETRVDADDTDQPDGSVVLHEGDDGTHSPLLLGYDHDNADDTFDMQALIQEIENMDPRPFSDFQNSTLLEIPLNQKTPTRRPAYHSWEWVETPERHYTEVIPILNGLLNITIPAYEPSYPDIRDVPIPAKDIEMQAVVHVHGSDVLKMGFMAGRCGLDNIFFGLIKKYYLESVVNNWSFKTQQLLDVLLCIERDEDDELLWGDGAQKLVQDNFLEIFVPDQSNVKKLYWLMGAYFLASEWYKKVQNGVLTNPDQGIIEYGQKLYARKSHEIFEEGKIVLPLITPLMYLVDTWLLGGESLAIEVLPTVRNLGLKLTGWHHEFLESSYFEVAKRLLVFTYFFRKMKFYFQTNTKRYLEKNRMKLCALVSCLAKAKASSNQQLQKDVEDRIKEFVRQAYDYSFFSWVRFKGNTLFWSTVGVETFCMLPALVKGLIKYFELCRMVAQMASNVRDL